MSLYIGIDLGTTNSVVCSYDGSDTRVWKSPEQNDVTPSAIYIDRRGHKHIGKRAYDYAPHEPQSVATLFKRFMGTSTRIELSTASSALTPQECSAEILRCLYGYLQQAMGDDVPTGTVITVPAAFDQMKKNATLEAARLANIGHVALMQEPVAAIMKVMKSCSSDGIFVVYDLGGGTLDVAIAQTDSGHVNLLSHGGIAMCGGRDFDRRLVDNIIKPWLLESFDLPNDLSNHPEYRSLMRLCAWAAERAKIELSPRDEASIRLLEGEAGVLDRSGKRIYLDIPINRDTLSRLIDDKVNESIQEVRTTLSKSGLQAHDIERIVFVGGPTNYKPLREQVTGELAIAGSTEVNPMTAVAEGAALFAESIDWKSESRQQKSSRGTIVSQSRLKISFVFTARTPDDYARIVAKVEGDLGSRTELQVDCLDTGWTSGRLPLENDAALDVYLARSGDNQFKVSAIGSTGMPIDLEEDKITITKTPMIDSIPASHAVGIEVADRVGGKRTLDWIVKAGDTLPVRCSKVFKAEHSLAAGSNDSLNLKLYEGDGEIDEPLDNRFVGQLKISGNDFEDGHIASGSTLECDFQMQESGAISIEVSIPSVKGTFGKGHNFYSWQREGFDFNDPGATSRVIDEANQVLNRLVELKKIADDPSLTQIHGYLKMIADIESSHADPERIQETMETVLEARRAIGKFKKDHMTEIRQGEFDKLAEIVRKNVRRGASTIEARSIDNLVQSIQEALVRDDRDFDLYMKELWRTCLEILWRQDWFIVMRFEQMSSSADRFSDIDEFQSLVSQGRAYIDARDIQSLKGVVVRLSDIQIDGRERLETDVANILRT